MTDEDDAGTTDATRQETLEGGFRYTYPKTKKEKRHGLEEIIEERF
jgi:hypothetical protein